MQPGQYPPPPPSAYAPPAPPAYPAAPPAPSYGPPTTTAGGYNVQPGGDGFVAPPPPSAGFDGPRLMDLGVGRLVMFVPRLIERGIPVPDPKEAAAGKKQDRVTADLIVLDGAPYGYGGKPERGSQHTKGGGPGMRYPSMWVSQKVLVSQLEGLVDPSGKLKALGRLAQQPSRNPKNNPSWILTDPTEADREIARAYLRDEATRASQAGVSAPAPVPAVSPVPPTGAAPYAPAQPAAYTPPPAPAYAPPPPPPPAPVAVANPGYPAEWWATLDANGQAYYASPAAVAQHLPHLAAPAPTGVAPGAQASWA